jgi:CMP-N,N'-diacetyllegionaminic acid synthase
MQILFTVCGRAGSKGIKNKNVRDFAGYPLPYYTFAAIGLYLKEYSDDKVDIALNTDSQKLVDIADHNPFVKVQIIPRKPELGGDRVAKTAVILDTLLQMEIREKKQYEMVVDLDLTSPLRTVEDIRNLITTHKEKCPDVTFSVTDARRNPYFNMVMEAEKGVRRVLPSDFVARQQAPAVYDMNASLYAYDPEYLKNGNDVLAGYCEIIKMTDTGVLDLDRETDFELMEVVAKYLFERKKAFAVIYENIVRHVTEF